MTEQTSSYAELVAARDRLERQIEIARRREIEEAAVQIRDTMSRLGMTVSDLELEKLSAPKKSSLEPKYRHPHTGQTWAGRGKVPTWMEAELANGAKKEDFLIQPANQPG